MAAGPAGPAGAADQAAASKTGKYIAPGLREGAATRRGETMPRSQRGMYSQQELQEFQVSEIPLYSPLCHLMSLKHITESFIFSSNTSLLKTDTNNYEQFVFSVP